MKGNKKLLSVLLAAAMVGQMGVVVGMGAPTCGHKSPTGKECRDGIHWIVSNTTKTLSGGAGKNYFYPKVGDTAINCEGTKNVIIFQSAFLSEIKKMQDDSQDIQPVNISNFGDEDEIFLSGSSDVDVVVDEKNLTIGGSTFASISLKSDATRETIETKPLPQIPENIGLVDNGTQITVTEVAGATYLWQLNDGKGGTAFTDIPGANTNSITAETEDGNWAYRCVVIDEAGQIKETNTVTKVIGCSYTPTFVDIKATAPKADGTNIDWTTGAPFELAADDAATYTFTLSNPVTYSGDYCDKKDGDNHGYTPVWTKNGDFPAGVELSENGVLTVKAGEVPANTHELKLAVSVGKADADGFKAGYTKSDIVFTVKKATPDKTPDETDKGDTGNTGGGNTDPEKPGENTGGGTTDPDPNKPGEGTGGETTDPDPNKPGTGDNTGGTTEEEKPPQPQVTVKDSTGKDVSVTQDKKLEIKVDTKNDEPIVHNFAATVNSEKYGVVWELKEKNAPVAGLPKYIKCTSEAPKAVGGGKEYKVTVTIDKKELPENQVTDKTFILTGTVKEIPQTPTVRTAGAAGTAPLAEAAPSVEYEITVHADTTQNQNTGGSATTNCTRTIKSVTVTPKVTSPLHFKENDPDKVVDWTYSVEWNNDCQIPNCTHKTEDLIWKVNSTKTNDWAVLTGDVDAAQKSGELTILAGKIPDLKDNKITFAAYTKKADGTEDQLVTTTGEITVTRDPKCEKAISRITKIQSLPGSSAAVNVVKNKTADYNYIAIPEYSAGICEKTPEHNETDGHGGVITWSIDSVKRKNAAETITDSETKAFSIGKENGSLHVNGRNLVAGKVYEVIISATAATDAKVTTPATITVTCTPASSGSGSGSSGGSSSSKDDRDDSDWYQWQDFEDDISDARKGATVKVNLRDNTDMPFYIFDEARGKDVNLQMKVTGGYTWTVNGKTIKKLPENQVWVDLGVKSYKNSKMSTLCRDNDIKSFELENNGSFYGDMKLTMNLGSSHAKKTVYLYSYDEDKNKLTYNSSAKVDEDGDASFVFARSLGAYVVTSKALYGESPVGSGGGAVGSGNNPTTVYPPVASVPASKPPAASSTPSSSSSSDSSESSSSSEIAPPPAEPSSTPDTTPVDVVPEPEQKTKIPVLVPVLILSIAGVITATVLVVRSGKGKDDFDA